MDRVVFQLVLVGFVLVGGLGVMTVGSRAGSAAVAFASLALAAVRFCRAASDLLHPEAILDFAAAILLVVATLVAVVFAVSILEG